MAKISREQAALCPFLCFFCLEMAYFPCNHKTRSVFLAILERKVLCVLKKGHVTQWIVRRTRAPVVAGSILPTAYHVTASVK